MSEKFTNLSAEQKEHDEVFEYRVSGTEPWPNGMIWIRFEKNPKIKNGLDSIALSPEKLKEFGFPSDLSGVELEVTINPSRGDILNVKKIG